MSEVGPPAWHVDPVSVEDDARMRELQEVLSEREGTRVHRTAVIRRAVRAMHAHVMGEA